MESNNKENNPDCPICLTCMSDADVTYPLLCPTKCGYNFCQDCIERLISSSKDDYQTASDGNRHVKVSLTCPNCRGDLQHTINDTLILRKALKCKKYKDIPDSELTASELMQKHEFIKLYAKDVQHAEARLRKFHRDNGMDMNNKESLCNQIIDEPGGRGTSNTPTTKKKEESKFVDSTLFQGLEIFMSDDEQKYVQSLFTTGSSESLASGAQVMHGILQLTLQGMAPKNFVERTRGEERRHTDIMDVFKKRCPLPARLPKYYTLSSFNPANNRQAHITFEDDTAWDGSIIDAYTRTKVVNKKLLPGIQNIMKGTTVTHLKPRRRVKVVSVKGPAGRIGLQKGDVVTHLNGERFVGTASDIKNYLFRLYERGGDSTFQMVVNADDATAQALKIRSLRCETIMKEARKSV